MALPLILAGPMLRRVEPRSVAVWIAVKSPSSVKVDLYTGVVDAGVTSGTLASIGAQAIGAGTASTRRLGNNLHVAVVVATTPQVLLPGALHAYNVTVTPAGGAAADLRSEGLLRNDGQFQKALGYVEGQLPGFATCPARIEDLVLLHGSCQKPHGFGVPVQAELDAFIESDRDDAIKRPHQLFLTGDQIYADDVAICLLPGLSALGAELLGVPERLPGPPGVAGDFEAGVTNFPAGRRNKLTALAGLSSREGRCHLLSFGEFCAMYLTVFSPSAWPLLAKADFPAQVGDDDLLKKLKEDAEDEEATEAGAPTVLARGAAGPLEGSLTDLFGASDESKEALEEARRAFLEEKDAILKGGVAKVPLRADVARFRRALANVPAYLQFDDHECTDDWYVTGGWKERVHGNPLGRAIVRNALAAFTFFQSWGNDPASWATGDRAAVLDAVEQLFPQGAANGPAAAAAAQIDTTLGLSPGATPRFDFGFKVDAAAHRVVVLDTRTRRTYRSASAPPGLLSAAAVEQQIPEGPLPAGLGLLVVVSPPPVLGTLVFDDLGPRGAATGVDLFSALRSKEREREEIARTGFVRGRASGTEHWDREAWPVDPEAFERVLARLATYTRVLVLSGDVHYGAALALRYVRPDENRVLRLVQFTSSGSRNAWAYGVPELMGHNAWSRVIQRLGLPKRQLGWDLATPGVLADAPAGERLSYRGRLHRSPVLLPDEGWRSEHVLARPPDWVWELDQVLDERPAGDRPEAAQPPELSEPDLPPFPAESDPVVDLLSPGAGALGYGRLAQVHQAAMGLAIARGLQFFNNVGRVSFRRDGGGELEASQTLVSLRDHAEEDEKPAAYIVHTVSLAPTPPTVPDRVGVR